MARISVGRKSGFIQRSGVMRRESFWLSIVPSLTTLATAATPVLFGGYSAAVLALRPFTIVRTRGYFSIHSDQEGADEFFQCSFGMAIVSDQAQAIGVTAVPTPDADRDSDLWFLYEELFGHLIFASGLNVDESPNSMKFDSKGMRKVEDGQDIVISVESASLSAGVEVYKGGRQLIKLH